MRHLQHIRLEREKGFFYTVSMKQQNPPPHVPTPRTAADRVRFALEFAQVDLDTCRLSGWTKLREDLQEFFAPPGLQTAARLVDGGGFVYAWIVGPPVPLEASQSALRVLQGEIRPLIEALVQDSEGVPRAVTAIETTVSYVAQVAGPESPTPGAVVLAMFGTMRNVFFATFFALLAADHMHQLRRCPACRTIFYAKRTQHYCTRRCMNRVSQRRWRERQESPVTASP
jgi:hypothetical protein